MKYSNQNQNQTKNIYIYIYIYITQTNNESFLEVRGLLGDTNMLPNQALREIDNLFTNSNTHISSKTPLVETVQEDDRINCKQIQVDNNYVVASKY